MSTEIVLRFHQYIHQYVYFSSHIYINYKNSEYFHSYVFVISLNYGEMLNNKDLAIATIYLFIIFNTYFSLSF